MAGRRPQGYSALQIGLHWTIAALILFQLLVNEGMQHAFDDMMDGDEIEDGSWAVLHIGIGLAVLALAVVRVSVRLFRGAPPPHDDKPALINWFGYAVHALLYGFIFLMPVTGALAWFGGSDLSAQVHELGKLVLIGLIVLHVLGAFAEHFVFRNNTLVRMLTPSTEDRSDGEGPPSPIRRGRGVHPNANH
jgi:cytochrome b561